MNNNFYADSLGNIHEKPQGADPVWRISAYALIERGGKYLMIKQMEGHRWELPGGGLDIQETLAEGIAREVYEETGYRIAAGSQPFYVGEKNFYSRREKKFFRALALMYRAKLTSAKQDQHIINTIVEDEIAEVAWVDIASVLESGCHPLFWPVVQMLQKT